MKAFRIAYDGRPYHGWQRQPDVPTVEDELLAALGDIGAIESRPPPGYGAAGRTDAGVSALAQTVAFDAPTWLSPSVLTDALPAGIFAYATATVSDAFHPRYDATWREYRYHLYGPTLDERALRTVLTQLSGYHDFHNLTPAEEHTRRCMWTAVQRAGPWYTICCFAPAFLRQQVRRVVAVAASVARGDLPEDIVSQLFQPRDVTGEVAIQPAPPEALYLWRVVYPATTFRIDAVAIDEATTYFEHQKHRLQAHARVFDGITTGLADHSES